MGTADGKATVREFYENYANHTKQSLEQLLAEDLVVHGHATQSPQDRHAHIQGVLGWNDAFSDTRYTVEEQIAEGDTVATRVSMRAVHDRGEFMGQPPTGNQVSLVGISVERVADGKIKLRRIAYDTMGLMKQLGLVPSS